ncbi:hypothetical protein DIPPA_32968 [Diplonema papillatum]|nr:hypothetical protein DIPPA_32968 [Diplonema papillatum]|eukprot:gene7842-12052_t
MFGLDGYGSDEEGDDESFLPNAGPAEAMEDAAVDAGPEAMVAGPTALELMQAELDFSSHRSSNLCPVVPFDVPADPIQAERLEVLKATRKNPAAFIKEHHDFINPERTNSKLEEVARQQGTRLNAYQSNFSSVNARHATLSDLSGKLEDRIMKALTREKHERKRKSATPPPQGPGASATTTATSSTIAFEVRRHSSTIAS